MYKIVNKLFRLGILLFIGYSGTLNAQENLIPNPGFEEILKPTEGHAYMSNVVEWYNTNTSPTTNYYGTPDHLYDTDKGKLRAYRHTFRPYSGKSTTGIISYMQRVKNYREYLSVKLKKALEIGASYKCTFYVTNGFKKAYGCIGTSGLGACFSVKQMNQGVYEPIYAKPQFHLKDVFYATEWEKISFTFKADSAYRYLTLGNFLRDSQTKKRYFSYDIDPQSYFYIDEVSLVYFKDEKPDNVASVAKNTKQENNTPKITGKIQGRSIVNQRKIKVSGKTIILKVWDRKEVDGDVISLKFNDQWIVKGYELRKKKKKIKISYNPDKKNELILFADHLGTQPPNTASFEIKTGKNSFTVNIKSDFNYCGAIKFYE